MDQKSCQFCGGACGRVCRGLGFKSSKNEADNRSAARKADKSPPRTAAPEDARLRDRSGANPSKAAQAAVTTSDLASQRGNVPDNKHALTRNRETRDQPKRGRPRIEDRGKTIEARQPWKAAGMSRASWYERRRAEQKAKP